MSTDEMLSYLPLAWFGAFAMGLVLRLTIKLMRHLVRLI